MELCRMEDTAVGNEGEDEMSRYQTSTKSLTIMIKMSLSALDITGDSGQRGGRVCGDLCDHCERVRTACHAAGVEKARGRPARGGDVKICGREASRK